MENRRGSFCYAGRSVGRTPGAIWVAAASISSRGCRHLGPVTANVCKMAIGHEGQIYQQLARCCGRTVLRKSIGSLDTSPPDALGKEGRKACFAEDQGRHF